MNISWGIIIAIIYVVINVASYLAKESAKRKETERRMAEAERQRMATARMEAPPATGSHTLQPTDQPGRDSTGVAIQQGASIRIGRTTDDLTARRQQQIEQLRARAALKTGPSASTSPGSGTMRSGPIIDQTARPQAELERMRTQQVETRRRAEQKAQVDRQRSMVQQQQRRRDAQQKQSNLEARQEATARDEKIEDAMPVRRTIPTATPHVSSQLLNRLQNRSTLRELIVLKEILDPPLGMRESTI